MNRIIMAMSCILLVNVSLAQEKDLVSVNYAASKMKYNDTAANAKQLEAKLRFPLLHNKGNTFIGTVNYKNLSLNSFPESFGSSFHGISLQLGWLKKLTDKKSLAFFLQGGVFSDMKDISGKDFRYSAGFRYRAKHSGKLSTGWGIAYSRQFFGNQIIPFIDIDYRPNEKWSVTGQFPVKPKVMYHFNTKTSAGFELSGDASSYRLNEKESQHKYIQQNQWAGLLKFEYRFAKSWQLNIGLGSNLRQAYKLYNDASATYWTIITIPLSKKDEPIRKFENKGVSILVGFSLNPFR
jgi:hypothetical protein